MIASASSADSSACESGAQRRTRISPPRSSTSMRRSRSARIGRMLARPDVVLVAVPGAHDVQLLGEVVAEAAPLGVEALDHAVHQLALADRAAGMHAAVLPGIELPVQAGRCRSRRRRRRRRRGRLRARPRSVPTTIAPFMAASYSVGNPKVNLNSGQIMRTGLTVLPPAASAKAASISSKSYRRISFSTRQPALRGAARPAAG